MKVLIADDHPILRSSLAQLLGVVDAATTVVEAGNYEEAIAQLVSDEGIELVLLDLRMPGMSPFDGLRQMIAKRPTVPVVVVSAVDNRADALKAIELGAMGFIPKTMPAAEFEKLLRRVLDGQVAMPRSLLERDLPRHPAEASALEDSPSSERLRRLTRRQQQVLDSLAHGKSNMQIAQDLGLSEKTVRLHVSAILKTLNLSNRTQAALLAAQSAQGRPIEPL